MSVDEPETADSALGDAVASVEPDDVPADAGHFGELVTARCVSCKVVRLKRAPADVLEGERRESFKHVCHSRDCRGATWWNAIGGQEGDS